MNLSSRNNWTRMAVFLSVCLIGYPLAANASSEILVFTNVRIFDGKGVLAANTVIVTGGKISDIGRNLRPPQGAAVIEGDGRTLLPGLIDCHTHVFGPVLSQAIIFGVTTELDMFTDHTSAAAIKRKQKSGDMLDSADLFSAGTLVTAPGGHGTEYGLTIPTITQPAEAQAFVDARIAEGSDYIKIVYDDGKGAFATIDKATLEAVIAAAHEREKLAVVHVSTHTQAYDAFTSGADAIVHIFMDREPSAELMRLAKSNQAFVIPTLTIVESASGSPSGASLAEDPHLSPYLSEHNIANLTRGFGDAASGRSAVFETAKAAVRRLNEAGIAILAGTDVPNPGTAHGASLHRELQLLVEAGLSEEEALAAATSVPAKRFQLNDRGSIARGMRADLVLVQGDPTTDITATRAIVGVWKLGVQVDRESYAGRIKAEKEQRQSVAAPEGSEEGLVSNFEQDELQAMFGFGWTFSTDAIMGGKSTGKMSIVADGARSSKGSLAVQGEIKPGFAFPWAGAMFSPGSAPMSAADLSSKSKISFWTKGDGGTYQLMVFAQSLGNIPAAQSFVAGSEWQHYSFDLSNFNDIDGRDLQGILFTGGAASAKFAFQIDEVRFEK